MVAWLVHIQKLDTREQYRFAVGGRRSVSVVVVNRAFRELYSRRLLAACCTTQTTNERTIDIERARARTYTQNGRTSRVVVIFFLGRS